MTSYILEPDTVQAADEVGCRELISILINNYNYANYVGLCIESAVAQSYRNIEVIVVDDGSSDSSVDKILEKIAHYPSVRLIIQDNSGQAAAMNAAFSAAKGKYIIFLDSDDLLDREAVVEAVAAFGSDTAIIQFFLRTIDDQGLPTGLHPFCHTVESGEMFRQILTSGNFRFMPTSGNIFSRQALERIFPIPEQHWRICADTYLVAAAAAAGRVKTLPRILGSYRIHGRNAWFRKTEEPERLREIARNHFLLWLDLFDVIGKSRDRFFDDFAVLSLIRRAAVGLTVAPSGTFSTKEKVRFRHALRMKLKYLKIPIGERIWHRIVILSTVRKDARTSLRKLLVPDEKAGLTTWFRNRFTSQNRHDWLRNAPAPSRILDLVPGATVEFGRGGNGVDYLWYGFGHSENWSNWASAESAGLIFRVPQEFVSLDIELFLSTLEKIRNTPAQTISIEANGHKLFEGQLSKNNTISLHLSSALIDESTDRLVRMHFRADHALVQSLVDPTSSANRISSFAIKSLIVKQLEKHQPAVPFTIPALIDASHPHCNLIFASGWDTSGATARQNSLKSKIRFSLPNPVMDRFAIVADFVQPPKNTSGDWTVTMSANIAGSDSVDVRQSKSAVLLVPRGKAPANGVIDLVVSSNNFLSHTGAPDGKPGMRVKSLRLVNFQLSDLGQSVIYDGTPIDFSLGGNGAAYLKAGWHAPNEGGAWASNTVSSLSGLFFNGEREVFVTATISTLLNAVQISRQDVSLVLNGIKISSQIVEGLGQITAILPRNTVREDQMLRLQIHSSALGSPTDLGPYEDRRPISICLKSICFESLSA